jgi:hypothetical protein
VKLRNHIEITHTSTSEFSSIVVLIHNWSVFLPETCYVLPFYRMVRLFIIVFRFKSQVNLSPFLSSPTIMVSDMRNNIWEQVDMNFNAQRFNILQFALRF